MRLRERMARLTRRTLASQTVGGPLMLFMFEAAAGNPPGVRAV